MPDMDLHALVASAADPAARDRAYGELLRLVTIFVRVRMGDRVRGHRESADVCQSVAKSFVDDVSRGLLKFDSDAALNAYLQRVVRSKLAELSRYDGAEKRGGGTLPECDAELAAADDPTSSVRALSDEAYGRVARGLSPDEAELVGLRRRGLEWSAIAAALGLSEAAARQRWSRLQRRLNDLLSSS